MTVRSLFKRVTKWTQGEFFREAGDTNPAGVVAPEKCYCLLGALQRVYGIDGNPTKAQRRSYAKAQVRVIVAIRKLFLSRTGMGVNPIVSFNDHMHTTIEDVRKVARLARV